MSFTPRLLSFVVMMALGGAAAAANTENSPAVGRALGLLQARAAAAGVSANDRFVARDVIVDADGTEHVRFDRTYAGLPVIGGDVVVHSRGGRFKGVSLTQRGALNLSPRAAVRADVAIVAAGAEFGSSFVGMPGSSLVVYARDKGAARLAWQVAFKGTDAAGDPVDSTYIVDARTGKVLDRWSNFEHARRGSVCLSTTNTPATGTGKTLYAGNAPINTTNCGASFDMRDQVRGRGYTTNMKNGTFGRGAIFNDADNVFGNNATSDVASAGTDAHFGTSMTWDYFKDIHGRNGIANDGKGALTRVHFYTNYNNAFWSEACFCMTFGDGDGVTFGPLVSLDIAGHEMTHGVTNRSANLVYSRESGGLNEATSDIFGTMVEFYANNPVDPPDYLLGEKIFLANASGIRYALRIMYNPIGDGRSPNCYNSNLGNLDVHYSSGVANHFFYLLAEGTTPKTYSGVNHTSPTCNSSTLAGIGRDKAGKIWYRALTVYMTSDTNYAGARVATLNAASDLYGAASAERAAVAATWSAVSVN